MPSETTSGRLRVGVVGTGFGAITHVPAFAASDAFEVVAIVSRQRANAERVATAHAIPWFSDSFDAMMDEVDLDVVSIATPGPLHHAMVLAAASKRKHVLCEKPFATSVDQA